MKYGINNRLDLIRDDGYYITIDESKLDIFDTYNEPIPEWEPTRQITPYNNLSIIHCDIETTGGVVYGSKDIDVVNHSTVLIGVKNEKGESLIFDAKKDERKAYRQFFKLLSIKKPDILNFYNGFFFDIPFIIGRCQILKIPHPFWIQPCKLEDINRSHGSLSNYRKNISNLHILSKEVKRGEFPALKVRRTAQINSVPTMYTPIWLSIPTNSGTRKHCAIIDTYHETLAWDFVARKLTSYRLKDVPYQMDLTEDEAIDLTYKEILERIDNWGNGGKEELSKYLESDLNLTKIIGDKLLPPVYNKCLFLDWRFQSIAGSGNGTQWNSIISSFYGEDYLKNIKADEKRRFKGAYSAAYAGLYISRDKSGDEYAIVEFDILSLYPHMILLYGLTSSKDTGKVLLRVLAFLLKARIENKDKAKQLSQMYKEVGDILTQVQKNEISHYDGMQAVMKVLANSGYGYCGTSGIKFNDYKTAALITAYGRAIFRHIYRLLAKLDDVTIISCFTGDTEVLTSNGDKPIKDILNQEVQVVNGNGDWVPVTFRHIGDAPIVQTTFKRTGRGGQQSEMIESSINHRWLIEDAKGNKSVVTSGNLKPGMRVKHFYAPKPEKDARFDEGVLHGIICGDGSHVNGSRFDSKNFEVKLYGEKRELSNYIYQGCGHGAFEFISETCSPCEAKKDGIRYSIRCTDDRNLKLPPNINESKSYIYGFIVGLFSTDGSVSKNMTIRISGREDIIRQTAKLCKVVGLGVVSINLSAKKGRVTEIRGLKCESKQDTYYMSLDSYSLSMDDLLRTKHKVNMFDGKKFLRNWEVTSNIITDRVEPVYCCAEPVTHQFVLSIGMVTFNTDTDGFKLRLKKNNIQHHLDYLNANLPQNDSYAIKLKLEYTAKAIFVPPSDAILNEDLVMDGELGDVRSGIKKNYIVVMDDGKVKANGKYKKRDRSKLQKSFQPTLVKLLTIEGELAARKYYRNIINQMKDGKFPLDQLQITRKVKRGNADKSLKERGIGEPGDVVTIHKSASLSHVHGRKGQILKTAKYVYTTDPNDVCWIGYIIEFKKQFEEVIQFYDDGIKIDSNESVTV